VPHEHVENAGTRKRRTLWIELPPIDLLENKIGQDRTFGCHVHRNGKEDWERTALKRLLSVHTAAKVVR